MTPTEIKSALTKLGGKANKRLGQHFLIDHSALAAIVEAAEIKRGDRVLEIGPGLGVLTKSLLEQGAKVTAIEKDKRFTENLNGMKDLDLKMEDAVRTDWDLLVNKSWKFVSNLPYAITSLALRKALYAKNPPELIVVLVQREVAERVLARDGKQSLLSLMVALASNKVEIIKRVPAGAFYPPPKVESAILKISPISNAERRTRWGIEPEDVMAVAKKGFAHPRKLLFRNLSLGEKEWTQIAQNLGIDLKVRAEDLLVQQWVELTKAK
ncbi:MAG: 16S rRNA (adenine(1518)-N(6)/adenine(1519)-N(6))-dimethyltransferase RsmA [Patescibacteria group bacterium]|nr:16S rRNA (adenine(1518)-N(6)/adenine(1519)-N(6))-dimethyltransferase RsmA [Patescibacteria group bacterium]